MSERKSVGLPDRIEGDILNFILEGEYKEGERLPRFPRAARAAFVAANFLTANNPHPVTYPARRAPSSS
jgi:hypothetical protein